MPQSHSAVGHERLQVFVTLPLLPAKPLPTIELDGCRHPTDCSFPQACRLLACLFLENTIPHISQHMTRKIEISDVLGCQSHRSTVCQVAGTPARRSGADRTGCCRKIPTWRSLSSATLHHKSTSLQRGRPPLLVTFVAQSSFCGEPTRHPPSACSSGRSIWPFSLDRILFNTTHSQSTQCAPDPL